MKVVVVPITQRLQKTLADSACAACLATIRLRSSQGVKVDLLFASSGTEAETIARERGYARKQDLSAKLTTLLETSH